MKQYDTDEGSDLFSIAIPTKHKDKALVTCFECGVVGHCHEHHVVPKILGGTKTVPLCESCHGKVHGRNMVGHTRLVLAGMASAKAAGRHMGRPTGSGMGDAALLAKHADVVRRLQDKQSIRDTAKLTGKAKGTVETIRKILPREKS